VRAFTLVTVLSATLTGHDFYILPTAFQVSPKASISVALHNGDAFPESEGPPVLARVRDTQLRSAFGPVSVEGLHVDGKRLLGTATAPERAGTLLLSARTIPNFIELAPDKFLEYAKEEGLANIVEWRAKHGESSKPSRERYSKFAKSILSSGATDDTYKQVIGFVLEIVPEANPSALHAGAQLPVQVLFRGKPAAGLQLEAAWSGGPGKNKVTIIGRTDAQGRIRVPLNGEGKWRLHTLMMERCSEPAAADWESYWASLTFEIR
jgi:uncharacterized GH25 family protein